MKALLPRWTAEFLLKEQTHQHVCMSVGVGYRRWRFGSGEESET